MFADQSKTESTRVKEEAKSDSRESKGKQEETGRSEVMSVSSSTQEAIVIAPFTREAQTVGGVRAQATSRLQLKPSSNSNSGSQRAEGVGISAEGLPSLLPSPTSFYLKHML